ncbi:CatB-related O-acetyltransferase [Phenylobacterium sp.]|uniref:CatB-related O-acetyltransferase n=1 Tax=Phenylobacterium sp. TaxID=1871053 RepID=UPI002DF6BD50|nr:CatB-related O-acetyltransferase [Phenylobacterium sp.]
MARIRVTAQLLELFRKGRIFHAVGQGDRWRVGQVLTTATTVALEPYCQIFGGEVLPMRMGAFSYTHSAVTGHVRIGRYCSIGERVSWMGDAHPVGWASTSPFSYGPDPLQGVKAFFEDRGQAPRPRPFPGPDRAIVVGHDVWIGDEAMIAQGVTVGHGAVIGARSLVLHDVPPYAIVVGSPARVLRMRFDEGLAARLERAGWWDYMPDFLQNLPVEDPERFLEAFEAGVAADGPQRINPRLVTYAEIAAAGEEVG